MSWFTDLYSAPYNAVTGQLTQGQKDDLVESGKAQIQSVVDNTAKYYGEDSASYHTASSVAAMMEDKVQGDVDNLAAIDAAEGCSGGLNLKGLGLGCISSFADIKKWVDIILFLGVLAVVLYGLTISLPYIAALKGRK
jgi:hypothetical protein